MKKASGYIAFTLLFWWAALSVSGFALLFDGECFADAACNRHKAQVGAVLSAMAVVAYGMALRRFTR